MKLLRLSVNSDDRGESMPGRSMLHRERNITASAAANADAQLDAA